MVTYTGSAGNDHSYSTPDGDGETLVGVASGVPVDGNAAGNDFLYGNEGNDRLLGYRGSDWLFGGNDNDEVYGDARLAHHMSATDIGDYLYGGSGNDSLFGGAGDDYLSGDSGVNALTGGGGIDTAFYTASSSGLTVNLATGTAQAFGYADDTLSEVENVDGSEHADDITGDDMANQFWGFAGNDTLDGAGGTDTARFMGDRTFYTVTFLIDGSIQITDNRSQAQIDADSGHPPYNKSDGTDILWNFEFVRFKDGTVAVADLLPDDFADTYNDATRPLGSLGMTTYVSGSIEAEADQDAFAVELVAGTTYIFDLRGVPSLSGSLPDPLLQLVDAAGNLLSTDNDGGWPYGNARIVYTATATGTYYLYAGGFGNNTGTYTLASMLAATEAGDEVIGTDESDYIEARAGDDQVFANGGNDTVFGGDGNDTLYGGNGNDSLYGGLGNDVIQAWYGDKGIFGGVGLDTVDYRFAENSGSVWVDLQNAEVRHSFGFYRDFILSIENVLLGRSNDRVDGSDAANVITSGGGADTIDGAFGADSIYAGIGFDSVMGGGDSDFISAGNGNDTVFGDTGRDVILGGVGNDLLYGGAQSDTITGGAGADNLYGGQDVDVFVFGSTADSGNAEANRDTIHDFQAANATQSFDRIDLSGIDAIAGGGDDAFTLITGGFTAAGQMRFAVAGADVIVYLNTQGTGGAEASILLKNVSVANLGASDFLL